VDANPTYVCPGMAPEVLMEISNCCLQILNRSCNSPSAFLKIPYCAVLQYNWLTKCPQLISTAL
jgi:hypothetical protein